MSTTIWLTIILISTITVVLLYALSRAAASPTPRPLKRSCDCNHNGACSCKNGECTAIARWDKKHHAVVQYCPPLDIHTIVTGQHLTPDTSSVG